MAISVDIKEIPACTVVCLHHVGPFQGNSALFEDLFGQLFSWASNKGLLRSGPPECLTIYYDDPEQTPPEQQRISVCLVAPDNTEVSAGVQKMSLPGGLYAVSRCEVLPSEFESAWNGVMREWLPASDYEFDPRPCFESYLNDPKSHPEGRHVIDICVPVKAKG